MEFPHLGEHCSEKTCNRLDFLPLKCEACEKVFCSTHFTNHGDCPGALKNVQVPVCPLCGMPVPTAPGVLPDITVGRHIDKQCKSDSKKIFTNRCSHTGCKRKELIPVTCSICKQNFCLRHRHTADHDCKSTNSSVNSTNNKVQTEVNQRTLAANAAEYRRLNKPTSLFSTNAKTNVPAAKMPPIAQRTHMQNLQGNMTDDEALQRAIALSILELDESADRNRLNNSTAQHNATVPIVRQNAQQTNDKDKCSLS
ncbi:AN1-type zinc finger protein 2A [Teleopsis dalmanni]|uniref:AN1-type zinc finger protein 2A n=1 Tax=Teleopsis dalmanni TaxID=139649 RepID=UPI000D329BCC|nr:AN1-type zinc finger protein 2A [Teleopsis dalmanni]